MEIPWGPYQCQKCGAVVQGPILNDFHRLGRCVFPDLIRCEQCKTWHIEGEHTREFDPESTVSFDNE
jgi:hypothetical protein